MSASGVRYAKHRSVRRRPAGRTWPTFVGIVAILAALGSAEFYAVLQHRPGATTSPAAVAARSAPPIGSLDVPAASAVVGPRTILSGWALATTGIRGVEARFDGHIVAARYGLARADVAAAKPGFPDSARAAFELELDLGAATSDGADRRSVEVVAVANDGVETVLGRRDIVGAQALARWRDLPRARDAPAFYLLPAVSGIGLGSATGIDSAYAPYLSSTLRAGMRVPILYLRTTKGAAADYAFDPEWDTERRCGDRRIAEDALATTIAFAVAHRVPVLFTLNGGIWADASCDVPAWDVNDHLEQDPANCQWNDRGEVMADDALRHLPGSQDAPELGRSLTFNVYARTVRRYNKRNLQAAAARVAAFASAHPDLFVGVSLDPDTYLNPFFAETQWYDYNPGTLRQFREWLAATGPYAGRPTDGAPDLSRYRRARPLTLAQVRELAGRRFARWSEVDPPRAFPREAKDGRPTFWNDPWTREWETFRRHLVDLHYDELSAWTAAAGIPRERIWSAQGFMAPHASARPFAIHITSPMQNYDTGGVSVEGAVPSDGHLGAILYGPSALNAIPMETTTSLFATFRGLDPGWGVVEINTADLRDPKTPPDYAAGYRSLRDIFNYGARFASPMAWNGSDGARAGQPGYVTFTAWRNTPFEEAARDFMLAHANVPIGARLWTFGSARHADDDGWSAPQGSFAVERGALRLRPDGASIVLVSPREVDFAANDFYALVIGLGEGAVRDVRLAARTGPDGPWRDVPLAAREHWTRTAAGIAVPLVSRRSERFDQLRITLTLAEGGVPLRRVALWPATHASRSRATDRRS